jgi:HAD superfamily hydrolase (TIGR01459 family)
MIRIPTILKLEEIYDKYDFFILDQWGVMHDGNKGYLNAIECVNKLLENKKKLIIISNSSKRKKTTTLGLSKLGFDKNDFIEIMTSGEMIWQSFFNKKYSEISNLGKNCFYIFDSTKEEGKNYLKGLDKFNFVSDIDQADFILGCAPSANKDVIDFIPMLSLAKNKNIPFICANPDFDTLNVDKNKLQFCMGTISELYKNMGGKVFILGKPSIEIYFESFKKIPNINKSKILAIGDSLHHDIKGANNFGIDSLLITSTGIHKELFDKRNLIWDVNDSMLKKLDIKPTFICSKLIF